jgi:CubicO group peptidase (beta-lactamase class C family)
MRSLFIALLLLVRLVPAQSSSAVSKVDVSKVDALADAALRAWNAPGIAVAIVRDNQVLLAKGYGVKERGKPDPVTPRTVFAIGSATKAFTTAAMAMLVDEGKMSWDDPVRKHVDFFRLSDPLASEQVTLRDLASHRTGLSRNDMLWYASPWSQEEILRRIGFVKLTRPFRSAWQYQNIMFSAAGYAVGKASGGTWQDFIQRRIFEPLGMTSASVTIAPAEGAPDHASPHRKDPNHSLAVIPWRNLDNIAPAGAINASVEDLEPWVRLHLSDGVLNGKRLISEHNMAEMHTPQTAMRPEDAGRNWNPDTVQSSYGLGWFIHDYRGLHLVSHGGAIDGFRANITLLPREKLGIIVLSNLDQDNLPEALRWSILDLLHGFPAHDWNAMLIHQAEEEAQAGRSAAKERAAGRVAGTKPSHAIAAYAGTYHDAGYGDVQITVDNGALVLAWSSFHAPLEHYHYDTFDARTGRLSGSQVVFRMSASGEISGLNFLDVDFTKVKIK